MICTRPAYNCRAWRPSKILAGTAQGSETRVDNAQPFGHSLDSLLSESEKSLQNKVFPAAKTL